MTLLKHFITSSRGFSVIIRQYSHRLLIYSIPRKLVINFLYILIIVMSLLTFLMNVPTCLSSPGHLVSDTLRPYHLY